MDFQAAASPLRNEIDLTMEPQSQPQPNPHPMKLTLDSGRLTWRSTNQDLVSFLDLHRKYHHEFLKRLENHVRDTGYGWQDLLEQESELASCARGFVKRYGRRYWGSEESRDKYFYPDAFRDPDALAVYPQRKEEITRVIKLLFEKKARNVIENQAKPRKRESIPKAFYVQSPERVDDPLDAKLYEGKDKPTFTPGASTAKHKRTESNDDYLLETPSTQKTTDFFDGRLTGSSQKDIRPFSSFMDSARALDPCATTRASAKQTTASALALNRVEMQDEPVAPSTSITSDTPATAHPLVRLYLERNYYADRTTFLVSSNRQPGMGPVWVPFQDYSSASAFLEDMARECHPDEYDSWGIDTKQHRTTPSSSFPTVIAATVRLEWSELVVIRVRRGKDQDWAIFRRELQKAWSSTPTPTPATTMTTSRTKNPCCESDLQGNPNDGYPEREEQAQAGEKQFKISVQLHIMD